MNVCMLRAAATCLAAAGAWAQATGETVRMNQIQVVGTHNSYHAGIAPSETELWKKSNPDMLRHLAYRHPPLDEQLSTGVRQIELDLFADARGGRYAHPAGPRRGAPAGVPYDPMGVMQRPGFKIMHVPDVDYRSTCLTLVACLEAVRDWSRRSPGHLPIFILIETKQTPEKSDVPITVPEKFTAKTLDALDAEIRSVFRPEEMIVPDDVCGQRRTLEEAVQKDGWPPLGRARGKVVFLMDQKDVGPVQGHAESRQHRKVIRIGITGEQGGPDERDERQPKSKRHVPHRGQGRIPTSPLFDRAHNFETEQQRQAIQKQSGQAVFAGHLRERIVRFVPRVKAGPSRSFLSIVCIGDREHPRTDAQQGMPQGQLQTGA